MVEFYVILSCLGNNDFFMILKFNFFYLANVVMKSRRLRKQMMLAVKLVYFFMHGINFSN